MNSLKRLMQAHAMNAADRLEEIADRISRYEYYGAQSDVELLANVAALVRACEPPTGHIIYDYLPRINAALAKLQEGE